MDYVLALGVYAVFLKASSRRVVGACLGVEDIPLTITFFSELSRRILVLATGVGIVNIFPRGLRLVRTVEFPPVGVNFVLLNTAFALGEFLPCLKNP